MLRSVAGLSLKLAGIGVIAYCTVSKCHVWITRKRCRIHSNVCQKDDAKISVIEKESGREVEISQLLSDARDKNQWVVAYNSGKYELTVDENVISIDVMGEDEFNLVLSHRWDPIVTSKLGPVPIPMLRSSYDDPTWVDFLNHFNCPEHCQRVLEWMGHLYASKKCRALYFDEGNDGPSMVKAASRAWMWQELSIGRQHHTYADLDALWLHHVVAEGEMAAFDSFVALECVSTMLIALVLRDADKTRKHWAQTNMMWGWVGRLWTRVLLRFGNGVLTMFAKLSSMDVTLDDATIQAYEEGDLRGVLLKLFELHCGNFAEVLPCAEALCADVESRTPMTRQVPLARDQAPLAHDPAASNIHDQVMELAFMLNSMCTRLGMCNGDLIRARERKDPTTELYLYMSSVYSFLSLSCIGSREVSMDTSKKAMQMLWARSTGCLLTSAVANVGNKNISFDADRFPASFGVLCAQQNVKCEASAVTEMVYAAPAVYVCCLPRSETCEIGALARKRVSIRITGLKPKNDLLGTLIFCLVSGQWLVGGICDEVEINGLRIQNCPVDIVSPPWWEWRRQRGSGSEGDLRQYSLAEDGLKSLSFLMDDGSLVEMCEMFAVDGHSGVSHAAFKAWHSALADAPEESA